MLHLAWTTSFLFLIFLGGAFFDFNIPCSLWSFMFHSKLFSIMLSNFVVFHGKNMHKNIASSEQSVGTRIQVHIWAVEALTYHFITFQFASHSDHLFIIDTLLVPKNFCFLQFKTTISHQCKYFLLPRTFCCFLNSILDHDLESSVIY